MAIHFFTEDIEFFIKQPRLYKNWLKEVCRDLGFKTGNINFIFSSDKYVRDINVQFLKHDYNTDVITFDETLKNIINGDIFISIDTVIKNASLFNVDFELELKRVMVHGILHMCGYEDQDETAQSQMRLKEDEYLEIALAKYFLP